MNIDQTDKWIATYIEEFLKIASSENNLKYNETIMMFWVIFRIMNKFVNIKFDEDDITKPKFNELCEMLRLSILGVYFHYDLKELLEKVENQIDLSKTILLFYDHVTESYHIDNQFISPNTVIDILKRCFKSGGLHKKKISKRH